ncbi:hypothetical protein ABCR94_10410 [Streptomyces sp. 21So2-11]|uniref:hypothetical protein n=1 Tax=Streptomyces sp. 21So2-11 TaxID=3144408 RepID=UPI00321BB122
MSAAAPPSDYRLLVPRDWFRIDLTRERWRHQLKTFVDRESADSHVTTEITRGIWATLRNTAENGVAHGALEYYLKTESPGDAAMPASLLVSLVPAPRGLTPPPQQFARTMAQRSGRQDTEFDVVELPAGEAVRAVTETNLDFHVQMPGDMGYLVLAFATPMSSTTSPMGDLCDAIAHSLRWV